MENSDIFGWRAIFFPFVLILSPTFSDYTTPKYWVEIYSLCKLYTPLLLRWGGGFILGPELYPTPSNEQTRRVCSLLVRLACDHHLLSNTFFWGLAPELGDQSIYSRGLYRYFKQFGDLMFSHFALVWCVKRTFAQNVGNALEILPSNQPL